MFNKILVANRGEIACRIMRTAKRMGIQTVAVYSDADSKALHTQLADEAFPIGPAPARDSYLRADAIIDAAISAGADAIHPGYGFLSENATFCSACADNNIVFVGPPASAIEAMGSKSAAKTIMQQAGIPSVPGYHSSDQDSEVLMAAAADIGYPVLLKAVAGGGGKGMRVVTSESAFQAALAGAKREASASFGNEAMLVEKFLLRPRHIELQVFTDQHGAGVHLFERDCSVQRRHQKVIEEAPAPGISEELRNEMGRAALQAAQAIGYEGAGTVEFLLTSDQSFYFMEMNTRLQVEHPVTEMITGQDLVEWQLRIAAGEPLPLNQQQLQISGHAFEARIYAEDPSRDFLPCSGKLIDLQAPQQNEYLRIDTGVTTGDEVSVHYDPMIAKLIVHGNNRDQALSRLQQALMNYRIGGMATNVEFLYNIATHPQFHNRVPDTGFIDEHIESLLQPDGLPVERLLPIATTYLMLRQRQLAAEQANKQDPWSPWNAANSWRLNEPAVTRTIIITHGQEHPVTAAAAGPPDAGRFVVKAGQQQWDTTGSLLGNTLTIGTNGDTHRFNVMAHANDFSFFSEAGVVRIQQPALELGENPAGMEANLNAPMHGTVVALLVTPGDAVAAGEPLLVMEAMKMEHTISAPAEGIVEAFLFAPGDLVPSGARLLTFAAKD